MNLAIHSDMLPCFGKYSVHLSRHIQIFSRNYLLFQVTLLIYFFTGHNTSAQTNTLLDSLITASETIEDDSARVGFLNRNSFVLQEKNLEFSYALAQKALEIAQKIQKPYCLAYSYNTIGNYHYMKKNTAEAKNYYELALKYYIESGNLRGIGIGHLNLGMLNREVGNHVIALENMYTSLEYFEKLGDSLRIARSITSIANLLESEKKYEEALSKYQIAYSIYHKNRIKDQEASLLHNIGLTNTNLGNYIEAEAQLLQAMQIADSIGSKWLVLFISNSLGYLYKNTGDYKEAYFYLNRTLENSGEYTQALIVALEGLADIYRLTKRYPLSIEAYQRALKLTDSTGLMDERLEALQGLSRVYAEANFFQEAFHTQSRYFNLKDSIFNLENSRKLTHQQASYNLHQKQAEIELLKKDQQKDEILRNAIISGSLAFLLIGGLIVSRQRLKIRQNKLLLEKSNEVARKNEQLSQQAQTLQELAEELAGQRDKLKELDEMKSRFFANISHEFRTPLSIILNSLNDQIETLKTTATEPENLHRVKVMHRNAQRLLQLINQLLDLSKLESGNMKLELKDGDLGTLINLVFASFSSLAAFRNIEFTLEKDPETINCRFDEDKMEKILNNLISNALKFSPPGSKVELSVLIKETSENESKILIKVRDNGPGIPANQIGQVFNRFFQGNQYSSDEQGTGIGLALTKELVELHQGTIRVESEPGNGATFFVEIPVWPVEGVIAATTRSMLPPRHLLQHLPEEQISTKSKASITDETALILVVEDNADLRQYIQSHLEKYYRVVTAENGKLGVELALQHIPDLIITDRMMPELEGLEVCRLLKEDEKTSHIPVIMLTALATRESKLEGLQTGADDYLTKPFDSLELEIRVKNLLEVRKLLREKYSRQISLNTEEKEVVSLDDLFMQKIMKVVEKNLENPDFDTEFFAGEMAMSRMQLHRKLKALTGFSPGDFTRMVRLKTAARLLDQKAGNISEVAYMVGFNNLSYFAKCFREEFGINPQDYLNRNKIAT